ncbi:hypothetical protein, unlikely [Trypanosoma brucei gambiense DAL972]|uniref:Uncharacterized protein n=1 Tax=Trypanosoma brucei gambiense (strain MHOM/CI/86/DAL972) TaxID=679716 RepID=C9ZV97_TRYB9|nr:hypothetical protein, unlikely [Trypanosoma brucei gambiense DAL972]CBH13335.1 hypothetical protein, unlikely [Trypanosoma brucei gambiense DAL972]|eukprot:XP_011775612.1 hypothetical protein, unlikely [Trypanosoma brucei gambiense DAL972]
MNSVPHNIIPSLLTPPAIPQSLLSPFFSLLFPNVSTKGTDSFSPFFHIDITPFSFMVSLPRLTLLLFASKYNLPLIVFYPPYVPFPPPVVSYLLFFSCLLVHFYLFIYFQLPISF